MYLDNKRIFLAGATGSVGANILKHLLDNYPGSYIRASYFKTQPYINNDRIEYVQGDLRQKDDCIKMSKGCDCAIMAAVNTSGSKILNTRPWEQINDNVIMNTQMLSSFYFNGIKRVVFISSATVYQEFEGYIKEDQLDLDMDPHSSYLGIGWVMRYIERLCKFWHEQGIEIIVVRASNPFGPYSRFNPETSNFIPALIRKAVGKLDPFEVWGTPDVTRDVLYSDDFARAIVMLADNSEIKFDIFNVGSGVKTTVGDVVEWALRYANHTPSEIRYIQDRPTTIKFRALACTKIKSVLGWGVQYTIEEGVKKTTEWWIENKENWKK